MVKITHGFMSSSSHCVLAYIWFFFYPLIMFTIPMFLSSTLCSLKEQLSKYSGRKWNWKPIVGAGKRLPREAFSSLRFFPIWAVFRKQSISCKFQAVLLRWGHTRCPEWGNLKRNKLVMRRKNQFTLTFFGLLDVSQVRVDLLKDICYGVAGSWVKLSLRNKRKGLMTIDQGLWSVWSHLLEEWGGESQGLVIREVRRGRETGKWGKLEKGNGNQMQTWHNMT